MSRRRRKLGLGLVCTLLLALTALAPAAFAAPATPRLPVDKDNIGISDNRAGPLSKKQAALRQLGLQARLMGQAPGKVHQVGKGKYVELDREDPA